LVQEQPPAPSDQSPGAGSGDVSQPEAPAEGTAAAAGAPATEQSEPSDPHDQPEEGTTEEYPEEDEEQGYVHVRTAVFAVGLTIASLLLLVLLAGNVYQFVHSRNQNEVATVNGAPITQAEFMRAAGQQDQALQSLIDQKLIQQEAKKENVTVPDSEVDTEVGTIKQQLGSAQDFSAALQRANLTEPQLRDQIRTQKLAEKMGAKDVTVSDDDAQAYYNQNKAQFGNQTFDQAKDQIKTQLLQQKQAEAIQTWIANLRSHAKIVIHEAAN
jgi:foldase protein PrsA